jgi:hypothetical protein
MINMIVLLNTLILINSRNLQNIEKIYDIKMPELDIVKNIKCFWIKGFNLYELWGLRKAESDQ